MWVTDLKLFKKFIHSGESDLPLPYLCVGERWNAEAKIIACFLHKLPHLDWIKQLRLDQGWYISVLNDVKGQMRVD